MLQNLSPKDIIKATCKSQEQWLVGRFMEKIDRLYQYEIFKPILDMCVTLCIEGRLHFQLQDKSVFEMDEGNCKTIEGHSINKLFNKIRPQNKYIITIKKIEIDVIVHEIAHMIEQECVDVHEFSKFVVNDLQINSSKNQALLGEVKRVMIDQVSSYPVQKHPSELFARFYQLLSTSKEVMSFSSGYSLNDVFLYFENTLRFLSDDFVNELIKKVNKDVAKSTMEYIKKIEEIKHNWTDDKIKSIHKEPEKPKWSKAIKSIGDLK